MFHYPRAKSALLLALLLSAAAPAGIDAASPAAHPAATPMNVNLLQNGGFETAGTGGAIPSWTVAGSVHVETFGTRHWPSQAYANKWSGGSRYLACTHSSGLIRQTVDISGLYPGPTVLARLRTDFGGLTGHIARVVITFFGSGGPFSEEKVRVLPISNHYLRLVRTSVVPAWATSIQATLELKPMAGAATCRVVADNVELFLLPAA